MKNTVLLAAIGTGLQLLVNLFWVAVNLLGPEIIFGSAEGYMAAQPKIVAVSGIVGILSGATLLAFFMTLFARQK